MTDTDTSGTSETAARQLGMVLDLNKCLGCQTCTVSCKKLWNRDSGTGYAYWNNVETHPGRGYPAEWRETGGRDGDGAVKRGQVPNLDTGYGRAWDFNHQQTFESAGRPADEKVWIRPAGEPRWGANWDEDRGAGRYPQDNHYFYLPRLCNHCTHPACLEACHRGAGFDRVIFLIVSISAIASSQVLFISGTGMHFIIRYHSVTSFTRNPNIIGFCWIM